MGFKKFTIENGIIIGEKKIVDIGNADLGNYFLKTLKSKLDFVGQIDPNTDEKKTYGEMVNESIRCAIWLRKQGLKSGDVVFTCTINHMTTYVPVLSTFYNRASIMFGMKENKLRLTKYLLSLLKPKFIFADEREVEMFSEIVKEENLDTKIIVFTKVSGFISLDEILCEIKSEEIDNFQCYEAKDSLDNCILALTSGTTGDPKIIVHSYKSIMESLPKYDIDKNESGIVSVNYLPLQWLYSLMLMMEDILNFAKRIIVNETSYDLTEAFQLIEKYKVTDAKFSLGMIYRMLKFENLFKYDTSSLETITVCGLKIQPEILKFLMKIAKNGEVLQIYGSSEISCLMEGSMNNIDLNSCGYVKQNVSMKVIDVKTGVILGPEEKGEFCFKSPGLMKYYLANKKETDNVIDSEGWYHTGDLGYYDDSGLGFILGRIKNLSTMSDGKIIPVWETERALGLISEVMQCVILSGSQISDQSRAFAFVTLIPGSKITEDELCRVAKESSGIQLSIKVKILDELPLTGNGKIRLIELKNIAENIIKNNV